MSAVLSSRRPACFLGALALSVAALVAAPAARAVDDDVAQTLDRATARVEDFFTRAQSLVCTERVWVQPLSYGLTSEGFGRTIESELRLSWEPGEDGEGATEAKAMRVVNRVNGHAPKANDRNNCTTPERHETEPQILSMLLKGQRDDYEWTLAGRGKVDDRAAILLDFREKEKLSLEISLMDDDEDCMSFTVKGGGRGRFWLDAETLDVLRLDTRLGGQANGPLPKKLQQRPGASSSMTIERFDTTYRFRRLRFSDPEETIVLPVSSTSLRITQGAGTPRMRVTTEYRQYRRFLTGGRIVPGDGQP